MSCSTSAILEDHGILRSPTSENLSVRELARGVFAPVSGGEMAQSKQERTVQPSMLARAEDIQQQIQDLSGRDLQCVQNAHDRLI